MVDYVRARSRRGFIGSSRSDARVRFHAQPAADPQQQRGYSTIDAASRGDLEAQWGVSYVSTFNSLDSAGGSWTVHIKRNASTYNPLEVLYENDWVEIELWVDDVATHVLTGLIDTVTESISSGSGSTEITYEISGRGFGKIFETALVYFNAYADTTAMPALTSLLLDLDTLAQTRSPDGIVRMFLFGFLQKLHDLDRSVIIAPNTLANASSDFSTLRLFDARSFHGFPSRAALFMAHTVSTAPTNVWDLAKTWSDPLMCELFCDLGPSTLGAGSSFVEDLDFKKITNDPSFSTEKLSGPKADYTKTEEGAPLGTLTPRVYFRDLPFPTISSDPSVSGRNSPWFTEITEHRIAAHQIASGKTISKSGLQRVNTLIVNGNFLQNVSMGYPNLLVPLINRADVRAYGMRIAEIDSLYGFAWKDAEQASASTIAPQAGIATSYRDIIRDYVCLNHEYLSGRIPLIPGRPDIRIGSRVTVEATDEFPEVSYYVDAVQHTWSPGSAIHTTLTVTHGIAGGDSAYMTKLNETASKFELPIKVSEDYIAPYVLPENGYDIDSDPIRIEYAGDIGVGQGTELFDQFIPGTDKYKTKIKELCAQLGYQDHSENRYLQGIIGGTRLADPDTDVVGENAAGFIGRPNLVGWPVRGQISHMNEWSDIHADLRAGKLSDHVSPSNIPYRACGYGQLIPEQMYRYQPGGKTVPLLYGQTDPELIAWLNYVFGHFPAATQEDSILAAFKFKVENGWY